MLAASLAGAVPARAQDWRVDVLAGGAAHELVASSLDSRNASLAVSYDGPTWFFISAGAPLDSASQPWVAGGLGRRLERSGPVLSWGADLTAHLLGYRDPTRAANGAGITFEAVPFLAVTRGSARLELGSGVRHYGMTDDGVSLSRTAHESGLRIWLRPLPRVSLGAEARLVRTGGQAYPFAGGDVALELRSARIWAQAGAWGSEGITTPAWGAGISLELGRGLLLHGSWAQESEDPLYWNPPRRRWSLGLSRSFGPASPMPAPVAMPVARTAAGVVTIRLPLAESREAPALGGDFNGWQPVTMRREGNEWTLTLSLAPGVYRYAFQRADGSWFAPASVPNRVDDGFGGHSAVLVVGSTPER